MYQCRKDSDLYKIEEGGNEFWERYSESAYKYFTSCSCMTTLTNCYHHVMLLLLSG